MWYVCDVLYAVLYIEIRIYLSFNELISYVYEFGSGRGEFRKIPVISSYATAFCELSIAIVVSLSAKSASSSFLLELTVWCSRVWSFVVMRHCMFDHCNAVPFVLSSLFLLCKCLR